MRPSVVLLGVALGTAGSITFALFGTAIVFALLQPEHPRLADELPALLANLAVFGGLTLLAAASFYAQIKVTAWRRIAVTALLIAIAAAGRYFWPL